MMRKTILTVSDTHRDWLDEMNLLSFDQLMYSAQGDVIEKTQKREILRIEGQGSAAYLKRRKICPIGTSLEMCLQGQWPRSVPFTEYLHIRALEQRRFPVMQAMAVGEQRCCGFPRRGFILVEEVKGESLDRLLWADQSADQREELLQAYGRLMGRLHQAGFYCPLRLQDIIVMEGKPRLVMIDREARYPYARRQSRFRARRSLKMAFRRTIRSHPSFDEAQMKMVRDAYQDSFGPR